MFGAVLWGEVNAGNLTACGRCAYSVTVGTRHLVTLNKHKDDIDKDQCLYSSQNHFSQI